MPLFEVAMELGEISPKKLLRVLNHKIISLESKLGCATFCSSGELLYISPAVLTVNDCSPSSLWLASEVSMSGAVLLVSEGAGVLVLLCDCPDESEDGCAEPSPVRFVTCA